MYRPQNRMLVKIATLHIGCCWITPTPNKERHTVPLGFTNVLSLVWATRSSRTINKQNSVIWHFDNSQRNSSSANLTRCLRRRARDTPHITKLHSVDSLNFSKAVITVAVSMQRLQHQKTHGESPWNDTCHMCHTIDASNYNKALSCHISYK